MKTKKYLTTVFKVGLVALLFWYLSEKGLLSFKGSVQALGNFKYSVPATLIFMLCFCLGVIRWNILLKARGFQVPVLEVLRLAFIGQFFNIALPGAVSGDVVKAYYVAKSVESRKSKALGTILFDRITGLAALVIVSTLSYTLGIHELPPESRIHSLKTVVLLCFVSVVVFYGYLFLMREKRDPLLKIFQRLETRFSKFGAVTRIYEGVKEYQDSTSAVLFSLGVSVLIHIGMSYSYFQFAYALGEEQLPLIALGIVVPLGLLVTAVPIFPAGVGTGHLAFGWLFLSLGSQRGADIFNLSLFLQVLMGVIGGVIYALTQRVNHPKTLESNGN